MAEWQRVRALPPTALCLYNSVLFYTSQATWPSMVYAFCSHTKGDSTLQKPSLVTHVIFAYSFMCFALALCFNAFILHKKVTCNKHYVPLGPIMGRGLNKPHIINIG